ncbi:MAG: phosphatidylglycerol lysyltransferase domain-containing protein [Candidatus Zixiibacteriota bacterium]
MITPPVFPEFKPIELEDQDFIRNILWKYQPQTSELTFTNLFIWRSHYGIQWSMYEDWLIVLSSIDHNGVFAFPPIGPPSRTDIIRRLLSWLKEEKNDKEPRIERADKILISEIRGETHLLIESTREHFDYVYKSEDLIQLAGRKYHSKRNHIYQLEREYDFTYAPLTQDLVTSCLALAENWCEWHRCEEDMNLLDEWEAVREALNHFEDLKIEGGVIQIENKVEAFALGELLNEQTGVVHIEKANPEIPKLYTLINQKFCEKLWQTVPYVNREQDLGEPGLRKAKESYYPDHLEEKFRIRLA